MDISKISKKQIVYLMLGGFLFLAIMGGLIEESERQATPLVTPTVTPTQIPIPTENRFAPYFRQEYIESCTDNGASIRYCVCTYAYVENNYGAEKMYELADEYARTSELPSELIDAVYECEGYLE